MKAADGRHLDDDQMIAVHIGAEPRFARRNHNLEHLQECGRCARRYEEIVQFLAEVRDEANAEVDALFTPARLEAQRLEILQKLAHASHAARVIPFPTAATQNSSIFTGSQMRRWIAAAAAAGLIVGVSVGRLVDFRPEPQAARHATAPPPPANAGHERVQLIVEPRPNEEELLSRAEQMQQGELQVPAELEALGAITPIQNVALRLPSGR